MTPIDGMSDVDVLLRIAGELECKDMKYVSRPKPTAKRLREIAQRLRSLTTREDELSRQR